MLLEYCSSGLVSCADECRPGEQLPATGPVYQGSRRRRIVFAVQHCQFPALQVWHHEGPSDHLVVAYEYDATQPLLRRGPRRRNCKADLSRSEVDRAFESWVDSAFEHALAAGDTDVAWRLLSDVAEDLLCDQDESALPRSSSWQPSAPKPASKLGKSPVRSEGLRALLQLQARLRVALDRAWDEPVRRRICRCLRGVRLLVPELPYFEHIGEAMLQEVSGLVQAYSKHERAVAKAHWKERMRSNAGAVRNFVKRRAEAILAWESSEESQRIPSSGHHPALEVDKHSKDWLAKWTARPCGDAGVVDSILQAVPCLAPCSIDFCFEASALRAAAATMRTRAPGPDCWSADLLLYMPQRWWQYVAKLWSAVMATQKIPQIWLAGRTCLVPKPNGKSRPITILPIIWCRGQVGQRAVVPMVRCMETRL